MGEMFVTRVKEQKLVPYLRSYLRMYTKLDISKLSKLTNTDEGSLKTQLAMVKSKCNQLVIEDGTGILPGVPQRCTDLEFDVNEGTGEIKIAVVKFPENYSDRYVREIKNLQEILGQLTAKNADARGSMMMMA